MDGGELLGTILEFFVRLLYGVIRLIIRMIGLLLSYTWLSAHFAAMRRFGLCLAISMAIYLIFGLMRANIPALWTPSLTPIYQWQMVFGGTTLLLVGIALRDLDMENFRPDKTHYKFEPDRKVTPKPEPVVESGPIQTTPTLHSTKLIAGLVALVLVFGLLSAFFSERHEATLAEKLCAQANAHISEDLDVQVRGGAGLFDRVMGTEFADKIPCGGD